MPEDRSATPREGSLDAPTRHAVEWRSPEFTDETALDAELHRVFDVCHGCRRCFNLCNAFPTLFDAVDESESGEVDTVPKSAFADVVDHCYLCDMCYMSKCPYVPPHEWNIDFPHLMLRAKVKKFQDGKTPVRDKILSATDKVGAIAGIPVVSEVVNAVNSLGVARKLLEKTLGVHAEAPVPKYHSNSARKRLREHVTAVGSAVPASESDAKVLVFATCYGNRNQPQLVEDLVAVFQHNDIEVALPSTEKCCGMPKLELGDIEAIQTLKNANIPELYEWAKKGWRITAAVPSCVLMFKQELPLLFPEDEQVLAVGKAFVDPFEYLMMRHKDGQLATDFKQSLGSISYQVPCHLRVQNIGLKTRDVLELIADTKVAAIERCSGHDGTYAVKREFNEISRKIARPVARQVNSAKADYFMSDCPMAGEQISQVADDATATHPLSLLRKAYGI